jgi:hypothetical protein
MGILSQPGERRQTGDRREPKDRRARKDRRLWRRRPLVELPDITAITISSHVVDVIDISPGGILVKCALRLSPGTRSPLEILRTNARCRVHGRVLRCEVASLHPDRVEYQAAIAFEESLQLVDQEPPETSSTSTSGAELASLVTSPRPEDAEAIELEVALTLNGW